MVEVAQFRSTEFFCGFCCDLFGVCHARVEAEGEVDQEQGPQGEAEGDPLEKPKVIQRSRR